MTVMWPSIEDFIVKSSTRFHFDNSSKYITMKSHGQLHVTKIKRLNCKVTIFIGLWQVTSISILCFFYNFWTQMYIHIVSIILGQLLIQTSSRPYMCWCNKLELRKDFPLLETPLNVAICLLTGKICVTLNVTWLWAPEGLVQVCLKPLAP